MKFNRPSKDSTAGPSSQLSTLTESSDIGSQAFTEDLVNDLIFYVLSSNRSSLIQKQDLVKNVLKTARNFPKYIDSANKQLKQKYGMQMTEIQGKKGSYFLERTENPLLERGFSKQKEEYSAEEKKTQCDEAVLLIVLAFLLMNDYRAAQDDLTKFLERLGFFGKHKGKECEHIESLIFTTFVRQQYIVRTTARDEEALREVMWGPRAHQQIDKMEVLNFVTKVFEMQDVKEWRHQYEKIMKEKQRPEQEQS